MKSVEEIKGNAFFVTVVNAAKCATRNGFIHEMATCFDFPDYFGENLDAVNECMMDLSWIEEKNFKLIIKNLKVLEKSGKEAILFKTSLNSYKRYWDEKKKTEKKTNENNFDIEVL